MKKEKPNLIPVLLGADLNAYSVSLAFYEAYGVTSHVFARYKCGATENSNFIKTHICSGIDNLKVAVPELLNFADKNPTADLFLIPCADWYVAMLESAYDELSKVYSIHIPQKELWEKLSDKYEFYQMIEKEGIKYPDYRAFFSTRDITEEALQKIPYPAVLKPTESTEYWKHPFSDMRKVYFVKNPGEAAGIMYKIFESGYEGGIILQKKVGGEAGNRVLTTFSDKSGRVVRAVLGDVILEEVGKTSYGNHSAIITVPHNKTSLQLIEFLNKIKYVGVANIDIMTDGEREYVLEINTRQGRSCDYLRAVGVNLGELFVKACRKEDIEPCFFYSEIYWHYPPHKSIVAHSNKDSITKAERLMRSGAEFSPYSNTSEGILRKAYVLVHNLRLCRAIKRAYNENGGR